MDSNYFILLIYLRTLLYFHLNQFALLTKASLVPIIPTFLPSSNSANPVHINNYDKGGDSFPPSLDSTDEIYRRWGGVVVVITFPSPFGLLGGAGRGSESKFQTAAQGRSKKSGEGREASERTNRRRLRRKRAENLGHKHLGQQGTSPCPERHSPCISAEERQCAGGPRRSLGRCGRAVGSNSMGHTISQRPVTYSFLRAVKQLCATNQLIH